MKTSFFLLFLFMSFLSLASEDVLLMTSFEQPKGGRLVLSKNRRNIQEGLERVIRQELKGTDLNVIVKHDVTPYELHDLLSAKPYKAIFWVSHASSENMFSGALGAETILVTKEGINVKDVFLSMEASTNFLGLVGCYSESIKEEFSRKGFFERNPHLIVSGEPRKTDALKGLRRSVRRFKEEAFEEDFQFSPVSEESATVVKLERFAEEGEVPDLFVYNRGELVAVLPPLKFGERSTTRIQLPSVKSSQDLKLVFATNKLKSSEIRAADFGEITPTLQSDERGAYELMTVNGKPLGTRTRIFKFSGSSL